MQKAISKEVDEGILKTFRWNQRSALSHLLTIEEHMLQLKQEEIPHSWCLVKHYLLGCDHHVREAISHAERLGLDSSKYRDFHKKLMAFEAYPEPKITIKELVELRTEWRYIIEDPTLSEECEICDADITPKIKELVEKMKITKIARHDANDFLDMEKEMAEKVIKKLSEKYEVEPPNLVIIDVCHEPNQAAYSDGNIYMCKSGINLHVMVHEFYHHIQKIGGKHLNESEAEDFAIEFFKKPRKTLYALHDHKNSDKKLNDLRDVGIIYGGEQLGYGAKSLLQWLDARYPTGFFGQKVSTIGTLAGTIGGVYGALNLAEPYDLLVALVGGYLATDLWPIFQSWMQPSVRVATTPTTVTQVTAPVTYTMLNSTAVKPAAAYNGKYIVMG